MTLAPAELSELLQIALVAAREGAAFIEKGWRNHPRVEHKGPVDLVTPYDQGCEELLRVQRE